jgi:hypothetical protein
MTFRKRSTLKTTIFPSRLVALAALLGLGTGAVSSPLCAQADREGDPATALFRRQRVMASQNAFRLYRETPPLAVSASEFFSAGFLTDADQAALGTLLGPVSPERVSAPAGRSALMRFSRVALGAPPGVTYGQGDSVLIVEEREAPIGYGTLLLPTGVARVVGVDQGQTIAEIVSIFRTVRRGQSLTPLPRFTDPGRVESKPVTGGIEGRVLMVREAHELRVPQQILFIDVGQKDGVALGDVFEARGTAGRATESGLQPVDELMATLKVVHVRERTAAVKVVSVVAPHLAAGTRVVQVAKLGS